MAKEIPFIGVCFTIMALASAGLPGFANFASEFMVLIGSWQEAVGSSIREGNPWFFLYTILAVWGIVISATYLLRAVRWAFFGPLNPCWKGKLKDADTWFWRAPFIMLIIALTLFGCYPKLLIDVIATGTGPIIDIIENARQAVAGIK